MGIHVIKMPDIGEGIAEAEIVEWLIKDGQEVKEDDLLAAVMTDKATVEIPSPVHGKIVWRGAEIGDVVSVGSPLIRLEIDGEGNEAEVDPLENQAQQIGNDAPKTEVSVAVGQIEKPLETKVTSTFSSPPRATLSRDIAFRTEGEKPIASPSVRARAREAGIDLRQVHGSGRAGRVEHDDLSSFLETNGDQGGRKGKTPNLSVSEVKVVGLRRKISEKMSISKSRIPHITYIDEVDVTELEALRKHLNQTHAKKRGKLTFLPFLAMAMVKAIGEFPQMNAVFDDDSGVVHQHGGVHVGMATQTLSGLIVPVVRHAEALGLWDIASEVVRLASAAREGKVAREELSGSTITITSLGAMGGIATTPVINHPEVAIVGVNKMRIAPVWDGDGFKPRSILNLSSSFDHRVIDGWDAALFIQRVKAFLEVPATLFIEEYADD